MGAVIQCFMLAPTGRQVVFLRRYVGVRPPEPRCPSSGVGYHRAKVEIGRGPCRLAEGVTSDGSDDVPHDDPRWPTACPCGYVFRPEDHWQRTTDRLYRRSDTGELITLDRPPAGAMWYADWMARSGPDGRCLMVQTPAGPWSPDAPSSDGRPWERTGTPPNVTVTPSIGQGHPDGRPGWAYHGWLRNGQLVEC